MLEHFLDHLPWNPLWWELIFITLLVVIALEQFRMCHRVLCATLESGAPLSGVIQGKEGSM